MTKAEKLLKQKKKFEERAQRIKGTISYKEYEWKNTMQFSGREDRNEPHIRIEAGTEWKTSKTIPILMAGDKCLAKGNDELRMFRDWLDSMLTDAVIAEMRDTKKKV